MKKRPRIYPPELRAELVELVRRGASVAELARERDINPATIRIWIRRANHELEAPREHDGSELERLRAELAQLREENAALRRLASWYLKEPSKVDTGLHA